MGWRSGAARESVMRSAERRLASVAQQWRPTPAPPPDLPDTGWAGIDWSGSDWSGGDWSGGDRSGGDGSEPDDAPALSTGRPRRIALGPWSASAVRGLALLVAIALAIAAYWAWSGRPRAVADVPVVIAAGAPIPVPSPTSPTSPTTPTREAAAARGQPEPVAAAPAATVVVHVAGLVAAPGLVELPVGARVADALAAAGGVTRRRATDSVNLARILVDGEQILVGDAAPAAAGAAGASAAAPVVSPLNLNAATVIDLDGLPGIGPVIAARIVAWRSTNGPFRSVDELGEVSGIGEVVLAQVRSLVRV